MGTGTSQGVPMIAQDEEHCCDLTDNRNWRSRTSAHIKVGGLSVQVDAAPEFRLQCVSNKIREIDLFVLTHGHADHVLGMDDLRRFIDLRGGDALPVYSSPEGLDRIRAIYPYAIRAKPEFKGYPAFSLQEMPELLELPGVRIYSTPLPHGRVDVLGLVFEEFETGKRLAYYTDCKFLPDAAKELAREVDVLVLDALRPLPHPTHMCIHEAIESAHELKAKQTYFTHMTFHVDYARDSVNLPEKVSFAYDGLRVEL